jgi:septal ring factor EnvC (AmiA/AmiB activator)
MSISIKELETERTSLQKDFNEMKLKISQVEVDLGQMKSNLNALNGAIMLTNSLITRITDRENELMKKEEDNNNEKI